MSSGHGFDFFGFEWWYSFNKKTFRSFNEKIWVKKSQSNFNFFKKKKKKKGREVEVSLFFLFFLTETTFECWKDKSLLTTWNAYSRNRSRSFFVDFKTSIVEEFSGSSVAFSHSSYCFVVVIIISDVSLLYMSRLREGFWLKKGKSQPPNKMKSQNRWWFFTW